MKKLYALLLVMAFALPAFSQSSGPNYPTTASGSGTNAWVNASYVTSLDSYYATVYLPNSGSNVSAALIATHFDFSIPVNATITGVKVTMTRFCDDPWVSDAIYLYNGGTIGNSKASSWSTSPETYNYGGTGDNWGATLTPAVVNSDNFGVYMYAQNGNMGDGTGASVDAISITVYYSVPPPVPGIVISDNGSSPTSGSAIFEVKSTTQGFLLPRLSRASITSPIAGLLIYDNTANKPYYHDGTGWKTFTATTNAPGPGGNDITPDNENNPLPQMVAKQDEKISELIEMNQQLMKRIEQLEKQLENMKSK